MNVSHLALEDNNKVRQHILDEVRDILLESLTPDQIMELVDRDMDAMEQAAQRLLRLVGGRLMATLVEVSVLRHVGPPPNCAQCSRAMRLVDRRRERKMHGLVGDFAYSRPYFHCRACGDGLAPDDERFGVGALGYTPALSRVAAAQAVDVPFERAARKLSETLGADFCEADVYRRVSASHNGSRSGGSATHVILTAKPATEECAMSAIGKRPWTAEELDRLPHGWRYEIDEGELVIMAPAGRRHGRLTLRIARLLADFVDEHRLGEVNGAELGVYLQEKPDTLRGVDVAFFSTERVGQLGDEIGFVHIPPDLAVEIHDSSDQDTARKVQQYLKAGVRSVWVVDPEKQTFTQHRPAVEPVVLTDPDALVEDPVLPGFSCRLRELFGMD